MKVFGIKLEKALPYLLGGAFLLWLVFKRKTSVNVSDSPAVNNAINILDNAFRKIGTFDYFLEPVFDVLEELTPQELVKLHKDFGIRYYNIITGSYSLISLLEGFAVARPCNLSQIMYKEFDDEQLARVKSIYSSKMLVFPL